MIKSIIVDDEQLAIDTLTWQLKEFCSSIEVVATFTNPEEALRFIEANNFDVCFLDIDMPEMNGFEMIEKLSAISFDIIFTTAYNEYAIKAFKVSAFDYLLKPIDEDELVATMTKYQNQSLAATNNADKFELLLSQITAQSEYTDRIALSTQEGLHFIKVDEIIRLESFKNYTTLHLVDKSPVVVSKTLKDVELLLNPKYFYRVHKSHTVHLRMVEMYIRGVGGSLKLINGDLVPVSKRKKDELLRLL